MSCPRCEEWRRRGARFCADCGTRLRPDDAPVERAGAPGWGPEGELRQLTVAFCDLVGSTELSSRLDAEEFVSLVGLYHAAIGGVVRRYGGRVVKFLGDGALLAFGWPVANDDDAERAVRAALDLVTAVAALSDRQRGLPMTVRVGIHSGEAFVGEVAGGELPEETVFGETVNIASRLEHIAEAGTVVISDATLALVRGIFVTDALGAVELRGVGRPVGAHRVVQRGGTRSRFAAGRRSLTPFVGRTAESTKLLELCRSTTAGARAALVTGEPGIGKSRLVYEVKSALRATPHTWLEAQCSSYTRNTALRPVVDVLEEALAWTSVELHARGAHLRAALERVGLLTEQSFAVVADLLSLPVDRVATGMGADEWRRVTYEVLTDWIGALARHQPLIVVVEDLQWADASTLELLTVLAEQATEVPLTVIATARPEFDSSLLVAGAAEVVELTPLATAEMRTLVAALPASTTSVDHIVEFSSGVPLYAEELASSASGGVPATLHELLTARLDRAGPAKRIAQICAVIGDDIDEGLVATTGDVEPAAVAAALDQLTRQRLLVRAGTGGDVSYTFRHALLRDAAYQSLLRRARRELHARVAASLHTRWDRGAPGIEAERVARHYRAAGLTRQAVEMYRAAAQRCADQAAHFERSAHLSAALELLGEPDAALRCSVLLDLGDALWRGGEYEPARARFSEAAGAAEQAGDAAGLARAALGYAGRMGYGAGTGNATLVDLLPRALAELPVEEVGLRAMVTARLAQALAFAGDPERRFELADQALELAGPTVEAGQRATVYTDVHLAIGGPDTLERRLSVARTAISLAREAGDMRLEAEGQMWLVADLLEASDVARARAEHQRWASLAEHLQDNYQLWAVAVVRAMFTLLDGDLEASEREATEALNLAGEGYNANAAQLYGVQISNIRREQGRWAEFEEPLKALVVQFPVIATWRASLGALYAGAGRVDEAREQLAALARDGFAGLRKDTQWLANTMLAADTCSVVGDTAAAEWLYRELAPYRGRNVMAAPLAACWGSISRSLGVLAATLGDYSAAEAHFEDALADNERLGAAFCIARTLIEYARMVQARGQDGDAERAAVLAKRALELAESRRLPLRRQQALDLLASLGDRPAPPG